MVPESRHVGEMRCEDIGVEEDQGGLEGGVEAGGEYWIEIGTGDTGIGDNIEGIGAGGGGNKSYK